MALTVKVQTFPITKGKQLIMSTSAPVGEITGWITKEEFEANVRKTGRHRKDNYVYQYVTDIFGTGHNLYYTIKIN